MRKIVKIIALIILAFSLTNCSLVDDDVMVCDYLPIPNYLKYEITYQGEKIKAISIVETLDFSRLDADSFQLQVNELKKKAKLVNEENGIQESIEIDLQVVTVTKKVDINKYSLVDDSLKIFHMKFEKEDLTSTKKIRDKIQTAQFQCDEIVKK